MSSRSEHMKNINTRRSSKVAGMLNFLNELETGQIGDYGGFDSFNIIDSYKLKGQLNSYRAMKICKLVNKIISKKYLLEFTKDENYKYELTSREFNKFIELNRDGFKNYHYYNDGCY